MCIRDRRKAVCDAMPYLPQAKDWIKEHFENKKKLFTAFVKKNRKDGLWADAVMCQATALVVGRVVHLYGTVNIGHREDYTVIESISGAEKFPPFTILYYQEIHYQSLQQLSPPRADEETLLSETSTLLDITDETLDER